MQTIHLRSYAGEDGMLHFDIPVDFVNTDVEVTVILNPVTSRQNNSQVEDFTKLDWHEFIERTAGSCADDPIILDNEGIDDSLDDLKEIF
jgi:hypothetical protein